MGNYSWQSGERKGTSSKKPNYSVKWEWSNPDFAGSYRQHIDLVYATNAERAINKVRKSLMDEYVCTRRDIVILAVHEQEN